MRYLKQSTATAILLGAFLDDTDGKTPETALTVASIDVDLYKQSDTHPLTKTDITPAASGSSNDMAHVANGFYSLELTSGNTDTVGRCVITANISGALPVWHEFMVLPTAVYDAIIAGTGNLAVDAVKLSGDSGAADNAEAFFDGSGYAGTNNVIPLVTTTTNLTNAPTNGDLTATMKTSVTTAATAATPTAAAVTGAVGSVTGNVGGNVVGSVASVTAGVTVTTNSDKTGYALSGAAIQAIWDALTSALTTVGSIGKRIADNLDATITSRLASGSYTAPPTAVQVRQEMDSNSTKLANLDATVSSRSTGSENLEAGKTLNQAILDIWAKAVGDSAANDADTPTSATYDSPDGTVQVTHTHTTTSRTKV